MCRSFQNVVKGIGLLALVIGIGMATPAQAARAELLANTCNGSSELAYPTAPNFTAVGDTVRIVLTLGAGGIQGGTTLSINRIKFNLDCNNGNLGINCLDDGPIISYQNNVSTTCGVSFSSSHATGDTLPNQVVFTPNTPIVIPANTPNFCTLSFDVRIEGRSSDSTPDNIEQVSGFDASTQDGVCDTVPPLGAGNTNSGSIALCPICDDGNQCNGTETCDPATGCVGGNPLTCNDNNVCTDDVCDPTIPSPSDPCVYTDNSVRCNDNNVCTDDLCDPIAGCVNTDNSARCNDSNVCTDDLCDPVNGCVNTDNSARCNDNSVCTDDSCDPVNGCVNTDNSARCNDNNVCTDDVCDPINGCVNTDNSTRCNDNNVCTDDVCDPVTGCSSTDNSARCNDNNTCTADSCDPVIGCVNTDTSGQCNDNNVCTDDKCNPAGGCTNTDNSARCNDNNVCTDDRCDPVIGCVNTDNSARCNDNNVCTDDSCDPVTGCSNTDNSDRCNDNDVCTNDLCDPVTGCQNTPDALDCDDNDPCTDDTCDPTDGCVNTDNGQCNLICRTPGFWGTHADADPGKACSQDITGAVIAMAGGSISVCGECISNSNTGESLAPRDAASAIEAMCVRVQGQSQRQLARQLTAAALNCIISSGSSETCANTSVIDWATCNAVCQGTSTAKTIGECIDEIDAFNNGVDTGCHDRDLPLDTIFPNGTRCTRGGERVQGPAGSNGECGTATDSPCTVIQPNETRCTSDSCP